MVTLHFIKHRQKFLKVAQSVSRHYCYHKLTHGTTKISDRILPGIIRNYSQGLNLSLKDPRVQKYIRNVTSESVREERRVSPRLQGLITEIASKINDLEELKTLMQQEEYREAAEKDVVKLQSELLRFEEVFFEAVLEPEPLDNNDIVIEVTAGVGGQEAMLFAQDVFTMYERFAAFHNLDFTVTKFEETGIGGIRVGTATISGQGAHYRLKYEGGVHRVQRVPKTEKSGRIHTSTAAVAILPLPSDIQVIIKPDDLIVQSKKASGAGGQHVNTTESAIRMTHIPTGISVDCQVQRYQNQNRSLALQMIRARIYEKQMEEQNAKISKSRKLQRGLGGRSEKIRTYNFMQDRVTDHRVGVSIFNIEGILTGGEHLDNLIQKLREYDNNERLLQLFSETQ